MSFEANLERVLARHMELEAMLSSSSTMAADDIIHISKELAELAPIARKITELRGLQDQLDEAIAMVAESGEDPDFQAMAKAEIAALSERLPVAAREVERMLLPRDEADEKNAILEVRAGTGGDEAALFAADLF
ncbi:MAG: PCRF domain-containing protein, partial [Proteobacteria bacterium]|nr:PCRF domain-containing protein [Pseudomonadota bacterium]